LSRQYQALRDGFEKISYSVSTRYPIILPLLIDIALTSNEIILLEEADFCFQKRQFLSPQRLFTPSKLFEVVEWTYARPTHANNPPYIRNSKNIRKNEKVPTDEHCNQWKSARNVTGNILEHLQLPWPWSYHYSPIKR